MVRKTDKVVDHTEECKSYNHRYKELYIVNDVVIESEHMSTALLL